MNADEIVLRAEGLGKCYQIYERPQDRLKQTFWGRRRTYHREFWALRDIGFELRAGESLGILGRNGSGKSTLLQLIAGTLMPTQGRVQTRGRIAALLELGSGFNPEFTGRENVFLNAAILGLSEAQTEEAFDAIAAFADIGAFIEQPVKVYSSGMMMRLAFAVQALLSPDILIVDEALAVGDLEFQHRCMRHIKKLIDGGTTFLFVSHSTDTVKRFCQKGLWLEAGQARYFGSAGVAAEKYLGFIRMDSADPVADPEGSTPPAPDQPPASAPAILPMMMAEFDLGREACFLRGLWDWASVPGLPVPLRHTGAAEALAGFQCRGSRIELCFLRGPEAGPVCVTLDGAPLRFDLRDNPPARLEKIRLETHDGPHSVWIAPEMPTGRVARPTHLWWGGGRCWTPTRPLTFLRDPALASVPTEVERYGNGKGRLTAVELLDYFTAQPVTDLVLGQRVRLRVYAERLAPLSPRTELSFVVRDRNRLDLFGTTTIDQGLVLDSQATELVVEFAFDILLGPGSYSIRMAWTEYTADLTLRQPIDQIDIVKVFTVAFNPALPVWYVYHQPMSVEVCVPAVPPPA